MEKPSILSKQIKACREQKGINQTQLANQLGLKHNSISGYENDIATPSAATIVKLAKIFDVSTDYLLGIQHNATLNVDGLYTKEVVDITDIVRDMRKRNERK